MTTAISQSGAERAAPARSTGTASSESPTIELDVASKDQAVAFYSALFGRPPTTLESGAALFDAVAPHLRLRLVESSNAAPRDGHLGIQMKYMTDVDEVRQRLEQAGYKIDLEEAESSCCYSVANKVWVSDPDRNLWEVYVVLSSNSTDVRCGDSCACEPGGCG